jgi:hypothetical protein
LSNKMYPGFYGSLSHNTTCSTRITRGSSSVTKSVAHNTVNKLQGKLLSSTPPSHPGAPHPHISAAAHPHSHSHSSAVHTSAQPPAPSAPHPARVSPLRASYPVPRASSQAQKKNHTKLHVSNHSSAYYSSHLHIENEHIQQYPSSPCALVSSQRAFGLVSRLRDRCPRRAERPWLVVVERGRWVLL